MNSFMPGYIKSITYNTKEPVTFDIAFISTRLLKKMLSKNWHGEWARKGFAIAEPPEYGYQAVYVSPSTMMLFFVKTEKPWLFKPYPDE